MAELMNGKDLVDVTDRRVFDKLWIKQRKNRFQVT